MRAYDLYADEVYRFVVFKVRTEEEARDITSQVFLKAWHHILERKPAGQKSLRALLYAVARTTVIDHYRGSGPPKADADGPEAKEIPDPAQNIGIRAEIDSDMDRVREKMKDLKDEYREILILRYINELSFKEIAEVTGKTKNNARVISHRALKALRELMEEEG